MSHRAVVALLVLLLRTPSMGAQEFTVTLTNEDVVAAAPTFEEYKQGFMDRTFTYQVALSGGSFKSSCTVDTSVAMAPTSSSLGGLKALSDITVSSSLGTVTALSAFSQNTFLLLGTQTFTSTSPTAAPLVTVTLRTTLRWSESASSYTGTNLRFRLTATPSGNC